MCEDLDIVLIFNKSYEPEANPIEAVFSIVKNAYKRSRLSFEANDQDYDQFTLIDQSFTSVSETSVRNSVHHSMRYVKLPNYEQVFPKVGKQ